MKHLLLAILMLLLPLLLIPRVQGIRLGKAVENSMGKFEGSGELPDSAQHQGNNRKLATTTTTTNTTTTTAAAAATASTTNQKNTEGNEVASKGFAKEGFSVKSSTSNLEHYPDIIDIAGMDYSPAKRKPPIHN